MLQKYKILARSPSRLRRLAAHAFGASISLGAILSFGVSISFGAIINHEDIAKIGVIVTF